MEESRQNTQDFQNIQQNPQNIQTTSRLERPKEFLGRITITNSIRWIIYATVFLTPLFFLPFTSSVLGFPKQLLLFVAASALLILWMVNVLQVGTLKIRTTLMDWIILGFVGSVLISSVFSANIYKSIFGSLGSGSNSLVVMLSLAAFYFVIVNVLNTGDIQKFMRIFMLSILVAVIFTVFQSFGVHLFPLEVAKSRSFNTVGSLNSVAVLASIGLLLALGSFSYKKLFSFKSLVPLLTVIFSFVLLIIANWWVLWAITIGGLIANFGILAIKKRFTIKNSVVAGVTIGLILLVMLSNFRLDVRNELPLEVSISYKTSFDIAAKTLRESPIFGLGVENFSLAYDKFKPASVNNTPFWTFRFSDSTSELLNKATEEGVLGLIFGLLIFMGIIGAFLSSAKRGEKLNDLSLIFPAFFALFIAFLLYPFNLTLYFALFVLLGIFVVTGAEDRVEDGAESESFLKKFRLNKILSRKNFTVGVEESSKNSMITSVVFTVAIILIIVGGYFLNQQLRADILFAKTVKLNEIENSDEVIENYNKAIAINPKEDSYYRNFANFLIRFASEEAKNSNDSPEVVANRVQIITANAVNVSKVLTDLHPDDSLNWLTRGFVYQNLVNVIRGSDIWAVRSYNEFQNLSPTNPLGYSRIGNVYLTNANSIINSLNSQNISAENRQTLLNQYNENLVKAEDNFKKAIELKRDFATALYNLGVVYDRQGRIKESIEQLRATNQVAPGQAGLSFELGLLYLRDNRKDEAFSELQRAVSLFNDYSNARWFLGLLYEERGELDRAMEQIQRVLELNPGNNAVREKLENLLAGKIQIPPEEVIEQEPIEEEIEEQ